MTLNTLVLAYYIVGMYLYNIIIIFLFDQFVKSHNKNKLMNVCFIQQYIYVYSNDVSSL